MRSMKLTSVQNRPTVLMKGGRAYSGNIAILIICAGAKNMYWFRIKVGKFCRNSEYQHSSGSEKLNSRSIYRPPAMIDLLPFPPFHRTDAGEVHERRERHESHHVCIPDTKLKGQAFAGSFDFQHVPTPVLTTAAAIQRLVTRRSLGF